LAAKKARGKRTARARQAKTTEEGAAQAPLPLPPFTRPLKISVSSAAAASARAEVLVLYAFERPAGCAGAVPGKLKQLADAMIRSEGFRARRGDTLLVHTAGKIPAKRVVVAGLGDAARYDLDTLRQAAAAAAKRAVASSARQISYTMPPEGTRVKLSASDRARAIADGFVHGTYRMRKYLTGSRRSEGGTLRGADLLASSGEVAQARAGVKTSTSMAVPNHLARDLVNEPAGSLTPRIMAEYARGLAAKAGLECTIHDEKDLERMGMGAFLGVSRGSHQPPRLIHLVYRPQGKPVRKIALVGKGLTFDSGGLSLKSSSGMETMKLDKAGASAVLGTMIGLSEMKPQAEVHGYMGMTENMPGGSAIKPGDVLRTCGGKTIEVLNTDAEGRLVLADILSHIKGMGFDEVIDLATLTGAVVVALGPLCAGVFSSHGDLSGRLLDAAGLAGEKMWAMPMYDEYADQLRSEIADIKNTGDRYGGAITAALFLREFIGRDIPWAHLDIAGPAFLDSSAHPYMRKGGTGAGVRTLLTYIAGLSSAKN